MSAEIWDRHERVFSAYCEECDWEGATYLDEYEAQEEMERHNRIYRSHGDEEDDGMTLREAR